LQLSIVTSVAIVQVSEVEFHWIADLPLGISAYVITIQPIY